MVHATLHQSLRSAVADLSTERIAAAGQRLAALLTALLHRPPRIAVAALNPHGGEGGLFGDEERRLIQPAVERLAVLAGLSSVGLACEFAEDTPLELIRLVEPDVLVKGGDYAGQDVVGGDFVRARGGRVVTPVFVADASTTNIVDRIRTSRP